MHLKTKYSNFQIIELVKYISLLYLSDSTRAVIG